LENFAFFCSLSTFRKLAKEKKKFHFLQLKSFFVASLKTRNFEAKKREKGKEMKNLLALRRGKTSARQDENPQKPSQHHQKRSEKNEMKNSLSVFISSQKSSEKMRLAASSMQELPFQRSMTCHVVFTCEKYESSYTPNNHMPHTLLFLC
jgi:hypothetical protein